MNILVIDIGTSSMRGILFTEEGRKLSVCQVRYQPIRYADGRIEQSSCDWPLFLEQIVKAVMEEARAKGEPVEALAVTAQRSAVIPVDREGKPLMDTIMWQDRRNADICEELKPYQDLIFEKSGAGINTVFSGSRMTWILRNCPDVKKKLYKFVNIPEYVIHHMTGNYVTDTTYGSRSHLMNLRERTWDGELLRLFGIREDQLCVLQEPGSICGRITREFAHRTGIAEGTPVISAGGDQQCALIGQGVFREGDLSIVAGTGGFLAGILDQVEEELPDGLICNCSSVRGQYMLEANVLTCCSAFDWFCRNFYDWEDGVDYGRINEELRFLDGVVSSPVILPYFQGRSTPRWNSEAKAVFGELTLAAGRKELLKALLEGICLEIRNNIRLFEKYIRIEKAYISGGLTNSPVINQMQSDVYGIPLFHMEDSETTASGALMVALERLQSCSSVETAFAKIRGHEKTECYQPRNDCFLAYEEKRKRMNQLYEKIYGI